MAMLLILFGARRMEGAEADAGCRVYAWGMHELHKPEESVSRRIGQKKRHKPTLGQASFRPYERAREGALHLGRFGEG